MEVHSHSYTPTGGGTTGIIRDVSTTVQPCTSRKKVALAGGSSPVKYLKYGRIRIKIMVSAEDDANGRNDLAQEWKMA